jgi:HEAT repeat protein
MKAKLAWVFLWGLCWGCEADPPPKLALPPAPEQVQAEPSNAGGLDVGHPDAPKSADTSGAGGLSPAELEAAQGLAQKIKAGTLGFKERTAKENAPLFLHLAQDSQDPELVAGALQGMGQSWTWNPRLAQKRLVEPRYHAVVLRRLDDKHGPTLGRAMEAALNSVAGDEPDAGIMAKLAALAAPDQPPAQRYAALDTLGRARHFQKHEAATRAFLQALDAPEPWLVSSALFRLPFVAHDLREREGFYAKARALMGHDDPGVRGRAALLAAATAPDADKAEVAQGLLKLLDDADPYVASCAASALGRTGELKHVPRLLKLLDDKRRNVYDQRDFTRLTGEKGWVHHEGSPWARVDDAALQALQNLTWSLGERRFVYRKVAHATLEQDLGGAANDARQWYAQHKKSLP